ncbi:MAG: hypothetical protein OH344_02245 [Candidatus Parvarchaeota archaeon]|nr:hypothetical protein [Candidatus Jingweiarchaeum tengchongense]
MELGKTPPNQVFGFSEIVRNLISKIDELKKDINGLKIKISEFEMRINEIEQNTKNFANASDFEITLKKVNSLTSNILNLSTKISSIEEKMNLIEEPKKEIEGLRVNIDAINDKITDISQKFTDFEANMRKIDEIETSSRNAIEEVKKEIDENYLKKIDKNEILDKINDLSTEMSSKVSMLEELNSKLKELRENLGHIVDATARKEDLDKLRIEIAGYASERASLNKRILENERKQNAFSEILEIQDKKLLDLFSSFTSLKTRIEQITTDIVNEKEKINELYSSVQKINEIEKKVVDITVSNKKIQETIEKINNDFAKINSDFLKIRDDLEINNKQITAIFRKFGAIENNIHNLISTKEEISKKIVESDKKQEAFAKVIEIQDKKISDLFSSISPIRSDIESIKSKISEISKSLLMERERIDKLYKDTERINEIEVTLNKNIQDTFRVLKEMDFVNRRIDKTLTDFNNVVNSFVKKEEIDKIYAEIKNLPKNQDISSIKSDIDKLVREKDMIGNELRNLTKYLDENVSKFEKVRFEIAGVNQRVNEISDKVVDLMNRMSLVKSHTEEIKKLEAENEQLKKKIDEVIEKSIDRIVSSKTIELNNKLTLTMTSAMNNAALNLSSLQIWLILRNLHTLEDPRMIIENLNSLESIIDFLKSKGLNTDEICNHVVNELFNLRREWSPFDESTAAIYETAIERIRLKIGK